MPQVHPLLIRAKELCEVFAVRPHGKGFVVWRDHGWSHERCGWRPSAYAKDRSDAEKVVLSRFPDLGEPEPPPPTEPTDYFIWGFDFGGLA